MSKYTPLWESLSFETENKVLSFAEIETILGFSLDHSFLSYKKELVNYGYRVGKISMKEQTVCFERIPR